MRFWDSSAVVPLVSSENSSRWATGLLRSDSRGVIWAFSPVEVRSALARKHRDGALRVETFRKAVRRADQLFEVFTQVVALEPVVLRALRLLDLHPLRAADALQLAAALVACGERPPSLPFVTLDDRLGHAAEREGFPVVHRGP